MKKLSVLLATLIFSVTIFAQSPQKLSYQAVVRNSLGKLVQSTNIGIKISILQGSASGTVVYTETHQATTNVNGLVSVEVGGGTSTGNFSDINWASGPYFLKSETDPAGGSSYGISGVSQLLSVPYALHAETAGNGFSGNYNDLTNKPVIDGSETKIVAGTKISVAGSGTTVSPYVINSTASGSNSLPAPVTLTTSQTWTVPAAVSKIKVELWGAAGGGGGAGAYSYSYNLNDGGGGGSGGYAQKQISVMENQQFSVTIGTGGAQGSNAYYIYPGYYGDTDGGNGGDSWFGTMKAAGGTGGKRGSYSWYTVHGTAGTANVGSVTGYASDPQSNALDTFIGLVRSYLSDRFFTSKPGKGGSLQSYSTPVAGEGGAAVITFIE
ncbi:MAG: glycine-rich domain-containing protein [Bacteroidales bacterium]